MITFDEALARSAGRRRDLLLGNGFSISVHRAFGYPKLYEVAVGADPWLARFFPDPSNPNFEDAMALAGGDTPDASRIRVALLNAVATVLPDSSLFLTWEQRQHCREFLRNFIGRELPNLGAVFTTNYDLLLHWVVSSQQISSDSGRHKPLRSHDGFSSEGEWNKAADAKIFYLHGAVHIVEHPYISRSEPARTEMLRYQWGDTLKQQIEARHSRGQLPVFVAEATAANKRFVQRCREYLRHADWRFQQVCARLESALFTFGHSFGQSDDHISQHIGGGDIASVYFGVFGSWDRDRAVALSKEWTQMRSDLGKPPVELVEYDARTCPVWPPAK